MAAERQIEIPPSVLAATWLRPAEAGAGTVAVVLVVSALAVLVALKELEMFGFAASAPEDAAPAIEEEIIAARFVRLGRRFDQQLPNRHAPAASPPPPSDAVPLGMTASAEDVEGSDAPPPDGAVETNDAGVPNSLGNLLNRADLFAELAEQREEEGDPDGIEEGTQSEAGEGDRYAGQIYSWARRGWSVPETVGDVDDLRVEATVRVGEDLTIESAQLRGSSGNVDFDQSVVEQLERLKTSGATIPEPPMLLRERYVGAPFTLRFNGRNAAR